MIKKKKAVKLIKRIDAVNHHIGHTVAWLALAMVLMMAFTVVQRYMFGANFIWQQELTRFFHAILFLSAAGYTLLQDEHVRVDVLYQRVTKRTRALINLLGTLVFLFPVCIAVATFASGFILSSWQLLEASPEYQGMPGLFVLKSFIWVFCFTLILQGTSTILRSILVLRGKKFKTDPLDERHPIL